MLEPSGPPPESRAYCTFTAVGHRCFAVGGRTHANRLCKGKQLLQVYDSSADRWVTPGASVRDCERSAVCEVLSAGQEAGSSLLAVPAAAMLRYMLLGGKGGKRLTSWRPVGPSLCPVSPQAQ